MAGRLRPASKPAVQLKNDPEFDRFYQENLSVAKMFGIAPLIPIGPTYGRPMHEISLKDDRSDEEWVDDEDDRDYPDYEDDEEELDDKIQKLLDEEVKRKIEEEIEEEYQEELRDRLEAGDDDDEWVDD